LRCPFGCREHHRQQRCCQRSTAYYRTATGRAKKKRLNARRQGSPAPPAAQPPGLDGEGAPPDPAVGVPAVSDPAPVTVEPRLEGVVLCESSLVRSPMLPYVRMLVGLIEGVRFTCGEVLCLLKQALRQHSIGAGPKGGYLLVFPHPQPP
jgi:hypothetical protein